MRPQTPPRRKLAPFWLACIALLALLGLFEASCRGRFPGCETDKDCAKAPEGHTTCFEKQCIQCRYDPDCEPLGSDLVCNRSTNTCETMGGGKPKPHTDEDQGDGGSADGGPSAEGTGAAPSEPPVESEPAAAPPPPPPAPKASKKKKK